MVVRRGRTSLSQERVPWPICVRVQYISYVIAFRLSCDTDPRPGIGHTVCKTLGVRRTGSEKLLFYTVSTLHIIFDIDCFHCIFLPY